MAGYTSSDRGRVFAVAELVTAGAVRRSSPLSLLRRRRSGWLFALLAAAVGYLLPGLVLARQIEQRKREIRERAARTRSICSSSASRRAAASTRRSSRPARNSALAYPALAEELRLITTEMRAGKPRLEAFKNFAARTKVDDVRALVAMLVQTDRFGTSIAQALRTHAETSRTKRRQRAEERAGKSA